MYLSIAYTTEFRYPVAARHSHSELRAMPANDAGQRLLSYRLSVTPSARTLAYRDYWGTTVDAFGVRGSHERLRVRVEAVVETHAVEVTGDDPPLEALDAPDLADLHWELLQPSSHVQLTDRVRDLAVAEWDRASRCRELFDRLGGVAHDALRYQAGVTRVGESVDELLAKGEGVCQDYAHLLVALCRAVGLPARYVSGYLFAQDHGVASEVPEDGAPIDVQTHAWAEALVPGLGWVAADPTNAQPVGERHVRIGAGRDYADVVPFRGTYVGGAAPELTASVAMRRLAAPEPEMNAQRQQQQ